MKFKPKDYAKLLAALMLDGKLGAKGMAEKFIRLLEKNDQLKNAKRIIELAQASYLVQKGNKKIVLEAARPLDSLDFLKGFKKEGDIIEQKINDNLVAGIKIVVDNNKQLDYSLQKSLNEVFK